MGLSGGDRDPSWIAILLGLCTSLLCPSVFSLDDFRIGYMY